MNQEIYSKYKRKLDFSSYWQPDTFRLLVKRRAGLEKVICECGMINCGNAGRIHHNYKHKNVWIPFRKYCDIDYFIKKFPLYEFLSINDNTESPNTSIISKMVMDVIDNRYGLLIDSFLLQQHQRLLIEKNDRKYIDLLSFSIAGAYSARDHYILDFFPKSSKTYRELIAKMAISELKGVHTP